MTDAIGGMRARLTLQSPTRVADELGGAAILWMDEGDVWADVVERYGGYNEVFDTDSSVAFYNATIRRHEGVRAGWRVVWGPRRLRITGVLDAGKPHIVLQCEEEIL